ncbi:3-hydroxybutyryl-CoA dehydrogenase [Putridiphycobacter roseus]|uniref:3-hydroxybutyryl-CoA dehydrogenase n=1 Tax=Putridiphycobacter roseus TaxID=2219161 RepID=A0A2W1MX92_9FLAO|nr:3-hydroxyacyl-CoA dehydrogenase NAD-binding domain-containing protein [Putridiphycobacter roseus]PZE15780.1 3-hydroxybutyryl-CoA dehydrogenase [Putridiphycobacter roseus]
MEIGVLGAGSMGAGIAQVASQAGHKVVLCDLSEEQLSKAKANLGKVMLRLVEKGRLSELEANDIQRRINYSTDMGDFKNAGLVIEAIVENIKVKKDVFATLENIVNDTCVLASNTSSLSIASIAAACKQPERVMGIHFFNPAPLMPLVEIIPAVQTDENKLNKTKYLIDSWKKVTVLTKDTPGFIVNRVARPFYGEALKIYEEGVADFATIDWAMTELGGFRMGPFTLMDYIGNDINYTVTESVFKAFYYDPRYRPSFTQKRHAEAGWLGRKSGRGYFNYAEGAEKALPKEDKILGTEILNRILVMLINEAVDAVFLNIASTKDVDLAMTKGVNYPKGLLAWANEIGLENVLSQLENLHNEYGDDRYRPSVLLRRMVKNKEVFTF